MSQGQLTKVKAVKAAEVCRHFELKEETRSVLRDGLSPREFVDALLANKHYPAAIQFLAHALPHREAILWGCLCLEHATGDGWPDVEKAACKAAVQWVLDPSEENRQATKAPADAAGVSAPAGALAMAVSWTGGSMTADNLPPVPPGPSLPAKGVAGAVALAAVKADATKIADTQRRFVELGIAVAEGKVVWPELKKK